MTNQAEETSGPCNNSERADIPIQAEQNHVHVSDILTRKSYKQMPNTHNTENINFSIDERHSSEVQEIRPSLCLSS